MNRPIWILSVLLLSFGVASYASAGTPAICTELRGVLDAWTLYRPDPLYVEDNDLGGGDTRYPRLDIDGDGVPDEVVRSCGGNNCSLFIDLSSGKKLQLLDEGRFYVGRYKLKFYVIVGNSPAQSAKAKLNRRTIYEITPKAINLVCPRI